MFFISKTWHFLFTYLLCTLLLMRDNFRDNLNLHKWPLRGLFTKERNIKEEWGGIVLKYTLWKFLCVYSSGKLDSYVEYYCSKLFNLVCHCNKLYRLVFIALHSINWFVITIHSRNCFVTAVYSSNWFVLKKNSITGFHFSSFYKLVCHCNTIYNLVVIAVPLINWFVFQYTL